MTFLAYFHNHYYQTLLKLFAFIIILGCFTTKIHADDKNPSLYEMLDLLNEVTQTINDYYVEDLPKQQLLKQAIEGMVKGLDPHSLFLDADYYKKLQTENKGEFGGLGIEIILDKSGYIKVIAPIDGTPAHKAGVESGDLITHLDGVSIKDKPLSESVDIMRGKPGTSIKLSIIRNNSETLEFTIKRDIITIQAVSSRLEGDIGYIRLTKFTEQSESGLHANIAQLKKTASDNNIKLRGYVLDLRNNPGGLLSQAVAISDSFLEKGEIVSTRGRDNNQGKVYFAKKGDLIEKLPLVVLINQGSASASEIVAGALQDHKRAIIMGEKSFGKGSVQTIIPLSTLKDTAIKLTTMRYYTPSGTSIQALGISPDVQVIQKNIEEATQESQKFLSEADLQGALSNDTDNKEKENNDISLKAKKDYQLLRALDTIKILSLMKDS